MLYSSYPLVNIFTPPTSFPAAPAPRGEPRKAAGMGVCHPRALFLVVYFWKEQIFKQREWNWNSRIFHLRLSIGLNLSSGTLDLSTFRAERCTHRDAYEKHICILILSTLAKKGQSNTAWVLITLRADISFYLDNSIPRGFRVWNTVANIFVIHISWYNILISAFSSVFCILLLFPDAKTTIMISCLTTVFLFGSVKSCCYSDIFYISTPIRGKH